MSNATLDSFATFGELLRYLRRRAGLTQRELGLAVGYSEGQVNRLESGQRTPDLAAVRDRFLKALDLQHEPGLAGRLIELAVATHSERLAVMARAPVRVYVDPPEPRLTNLPVQLTRFVGRKQEVPTVQRLVCANRLVTLTGSGGCGKTRLALEVGATFVAARLPLTRDRQSQGTGAPRADAPTCPDGVWLIDLAPLAVSGLVADVVAVALGLHPASRPALELLIDYLADKQMLLILDNCEHLIEACSEVAETLLRACPHLRVLATSRAALNILGEVTWRVPSLAVGEAMQLFTERAAAFQPAFAVALADASYVAQICRRLDGLPLALELAAARLHTFSVEQLAGLLDDCFRLLIGGSRTALPRHRTLHAAMEWSYDLLSPGERALLRRLAVFAGGGTWEAVEAVGADLAGDILPLLDGLVNQSLVTVEEGTSGSRYRLLETIRQYARAKLVDAGEEGQARQRHLEYFAGLAKTARSRHWNRHKHRAYFDILTPEFDNSHTALSWAAQSGDWQAGWRLSEGIQDVWFERGLGNELSRWVEDNLLTNPAVSDSVRASALTMLGWIAINKGNMVWGADWFRKAAVCARQLEDEQARFWADHTLGFFTPDYAEATALLKGVSLWAQRAGMEKWELGTRISLGQRMRLHGDYEQAAVLLEQVTARAREMGDADLLEWVLPNLGQLLLEQSDYARARAVLEESASLLRDSGPPAKRMVVLVDLGTAGVYRGDYGLAREALRESLPFQYKMDNLERVAQGLVLAATLAQALGQLTESARLLGAAAAIRRDHHTHGIFECELFAEYDRRLPAVQAAMNPLDFERAWAEGQNLTIQEAIAEALNI